MSFKLTNACLCFIVNSFFSMTVFETTGEYDETKRARLQHGTDGMGPRRSSDDTVARRRSGDNAVARRRSGDDVVRRRSGDDAVIRWHNIEEFGATYDLGSKQSSIQAIVQSTKT